jgi:hypothetical protein
VITIDRFRRSPWAETRSWANWRQLEVLDYLARKVRFWADVRWTKSLAS